jgi:hypothetical protein
LENDLFVGIPKRFNRRFFFQGGGGHTCVSSCAALALRSTETVKKKHAQLEGRDTIKNQK